MLHALVQHFGQKDLSNRNVQPDILGRAYEYLIKKFVDAAGANAGEFFTPPEVVDILVRILEPRPGESVYDPTCGSGGMLVHSGDYLAEQGHRANQLRYFGQEMNWQTYAIAKINFILHDLEGSIKGGKSTLTDPQHLAEPARDRLATFDLVMANFPFSDAAWWLPEEKRTEDEIAKAKKKKEKAAMGGRAPEGGAGAARVDQAWRVSAFRAHPRAGDGRGRSDVGGGGAKAHRKTVRKGLIRWLRARARQALESRVQMRAREMHVRPARLLVMSQRTKWGNCSARRNLSFNWRLILAPPEVLDYIVVHELAHLLVPAHTAQFWLIVRSFCPRYEQHRDFLKANARALLNLKLDNPA